MSSTSQKLNFSFSLKPILLAVFSIALLLLIASYAFQQFGYFSLILDFSILINIFVLLSWKYSFSLPIFSKQLRNKYAELKRYLETYSSTKGLKYGLKLLQFKIIYYLAILFYDLESATNILKDGDTANPFGIDFLTSSDKVRTAYLQEFFSLMEQKKQRATILAVSVSSATIALALIVITILSNPTSAATFGWTQTDWSGGASTSTIAVHPGDKTGWNKYYSKDALITAGATVTLNTTTTYISQTNDFDFFTGAFDSTMVNKSNVFGSVSLAAIPAMADLSTQILSSSTITTGNDIFVLGNYAYVADGATGLRIFDISNPSVPVAKGIYDSPGTANSVVVVGTYAYLADGTSGFRIVDVANVDSPVSVGATTTGFSNAYRVRVSGNYAYVADNANGLRIIDISNPASPVTVATQAIADSAKDVVLSGSYAYVMGGLKFAVVDISTPTSPSLATSSALVLRDGNLTSIAINGDYAYVVAADNGAAGVWIVDISNPTQSHYVSTLYTYNGGITNPGKGYVYNNYLYVDGQAGLYVYDLSSSTSPVLVARQEYSYYSSMTGRGLYASGNNLYWGGINGKMIIMNIPTYTFGFSLQYSYALAGVAFNSVFSYANYLFGVGYYLVLFDITNPASPVRLSDYNDGVRGFLGGVASGTLVYMATGANGLKIISYANSASLVQKGVYDTAGSAKDVALYGNYAIVADGTSGVQVIDVSSSTNPTLTATYATSTATAYALKIAGNYAYVAYGTAGMVILDLSDPANPAYVGGYTTGDVRSLSVAGNYAYLGDYNASSNNCTGGMHVMDISNPGNPLRLSTIAITHTYYNSTIVVQGKYVYVSGANAISTSIVNVSDPSNPYIINSLGNTETRLSYLDGLYVFGNSVDRKFSDYKVSQYASSGSYISRIMDVNNFGIGSVSWNSTVPAGTALTIKARSSAYSDMSGARDWSACPTLTSGQALDGTACIFTSDRYIQYRADMTTDDIDLSPSLNDITFSPPSASSLYSSIYDAGSVANTLPKIAWVGTNTSEVNTIRFQMRGASTTAGLLSATWCGFADTGGSCTGTNYFSSAQNGTQITDATNPLVISGTDNSASNNRYFQYRAVLSSGGVTSPVLESVTVTYVVNASPEFASSTTVTQRTSDGKVQIDFSALDSDTASSGVGCPLCVISTLERQIDNGTWTAIPVDRLSTPDGYNLGFGTSTVATATTTYRILWDAKNDSLNGTYSTNTKIRITLNDKEGGNNTAVTTTPAFVLDVKNPSTTLQPIKLLAHGAVVNAPASPATIVVSSTDDSAGLTMCLTLNSANPSCTYSAYTVTSTIMLTADPQNVYVSFKDAYNNTSTFFALTPDTPNNIIIKDVSDTLIPTYQEFIVWKAVASTTFRYYHVEHSTDGITYTELDLVSDNAINFYFHQDLVKDSNHYYRVYTEDTSGNTSPYTTAVNDSADGVGGTNPNPPIITNIEVTATTTQSATIEWDTNEPANSTVHYSLDPDVSFSQTAGSSLYTQNATVLGRHSVTLNNLTPGRTYHFTVESQNLLTVSKTETNASLGWTFSTLSGPVISDVTANSVTNNGATIIWNTDIASDSTVYYTTSSAFTSSDNTGVSTEVTNHEVTLTGLLRGTLYYYYVKSGVATDNSSNAYYTFTTPSDNVAPVINNATSSIVIDTQAVINWTTNEMSDSEVVYGTVSGIYNLSATDTNLNTNHNVILSNLSTSTTYYFKVISTDASGNEASSTTELPFTTLETLSQESAVALRESLAEAAGAIAGAAAKVCVGGSGSSIDRSKPIISAVAVSNVTGNSATFSWVTDRVGSSFVIYNSNSTNSKTTGQFDGIKDHKVIIDGLAQRTQYTYQVLTSDANGNLGQSADATFTTTDTLGLSDLSDPASSQASKNSDFVFSLNKINEYLRTMSKVVSLDVLETTLNSQYDTIRSLSDTVPPPVLSGEPRVLTTSDTATVTWKTDKNSNSLVALAPESKYDKSKGSEAYLQTVGNSTESVTTHIVTINDLEPETLYHYQVRSMLDIGSLGQSADFTFLTKPKQLEISNYTIEKLNGSTAVFKWLTNNETDGSVKFTPYRNGILAIDSSNSVKNKNFTTLHEIKVDSFESGINYEVELSGKDIKGQIISKKISTFSTGEDNFPPTIYQVQTESALSTGKESNVQTIISWLTDEPSTAQAFYQKGVGTVKDDAWEKTPIDPNYSKKHIIVLTKFEPGQIYQFKLQSADSNNNIGVSKVYTILAPKQKESVFQVIMKNFEEVFGWTQKINK